MGSRLPLPPVTSRSRHADLRQSSRDRRVFRTFPTLVLLGRQRRRRSQTSCWGGEEGGRELFAVALGHRTRCCCKVFQEAIHRGRLAPGGDPQKTQRRECVQPRGRRERVSLSSVSRRSLCRLGEPPSHCACHHLHACT